MCGINGIFTGNGRLKKKITGMNKLISHRGPDDEGFTCINTKNNTFFMLSGDDSIPEVKSKRNHIEQFNFSQTDLTLASRRLSIIDLSEKGHQPMYDLSQKYYITYNGEIYNYIELRDELEQAGFKFQTGTDTEVILNSYIHWGTHCLNRFNGMWAFALWDSYKKSLFLSRDRFGVKPLYYSFSSDYFTFSSEIKPLLYFHDKEFGINEKKLPFFLLFGNRMNTEDTYIEKIYSLKPAHYLLFENKDVKQIRYYDVCENDTGAKSEEQLIVELRSLMADSVKLRFRSDVPVGACLSGGFDSTSIVSLSRTFYKAKLNTFSAVWKNEKAIDESKYIDIVNDEYRCIPHKVEPKPEEFEKVFNEISYYQEFPSEGAGLIPQWYVMKKAKGTVKVLLDGQGGDEVSGGYFHVKSYLSSLIKEKKVKQILSDIKLFSILLSKDEIHAISQWLFPAFYNKLAKNIFSNQNKILNKKLLEKMRRLEVYYDAKPEKKLKYYLNDLSYHFISKLTVPTLLHYEDRSSMAHSIESRVPFLDYRVVEFGLNLKPDYLVHKNTPRVLFKKAFKDLLPKEILLRKNKLGFPVPFAKWTRGPLKEFVNDSLLPENAPVNSYIDKKYLLYKLDEHNSGRIDYSWEIWRLLSLNYFLTLSKRF